MLMAAPPMPDDLQIVQPDPSLPKELSALFGKWEGSSGALQHFLIVERINEEKARVYWWLSGWANVPRGWQRYQAIVLKERGKYKLWYAYRFGPVELTLKGEYLNLEARTQIFSVRRIRVP